MNRKIVAFVILIAAIAIVAFLNSRNEPTGPVRKDITVVAFGDSLVQGVGASEGKDFVFLLSDKLDINIINSGKSGDTTQDGLSRLEKDVLEQKPGVVILLLGGNDALRRLPPAQTFSNLALIIDRIKASGAKVLLLGVRGGVLGDGGFEKSFENLAETKKVELVPDVLDGLFGDKRYMSDSIHPNNAGYEKIADKIEPKLRELLK